MLEKILVLVILHSHISSALKVTKQTILWSHHFRTQFTKHCWFISQLICFTEDYSYISTKLGLEGARRRNIHPIYLNAENRLYLWDFSEVPLPKPSSSLFNPEPNPITIFHLFQFYLLFSFLDVIQARGGQKQGRFTCE